MCLVSIACIFQALQIHVKKLKINQEKVELWAVGCQSPPDVGFSHLNFGYLSKKCHSSQTNWPIFMRLVAIAGIFQALQIHVKKLMINQETVELWAVGCQSPPVAWFPHLNFGYLSKKGYSSQTNWPISKRLVAFTCIFEVLYDSCQKFENRSWKIQVMG